VWTMAKMRDGAQWLSNHYAANDYYCEGEHVTGSWAGKGAQVFGIAGQPIQPQNAAFLRIFSGQTPEGEKLKPHDSEIIGYDFQCSAQKSVSIMAKLGGDRRLIDAHNGAVSEAFEKLESLACVKEGTLGIDRQRVTTGMLCAARFDHDTSRALDPHLHTHFATANFSITAEGKRYALETHDMIKAIRYAGKVYQSALRRNVESLGYKTRDKINDKGQVEGFEVDGISDELCEKYSQRRGEIEEEIGAFKAEHGREPTSAEIHVIAKETRTSKLIEISTREVLQRQRERASADELAQIERVKTEALNARKENHQANVTAAELVSLVRDHLAERRATFGEHDLIAEALNRGMGKVSVSALETAIQADPEIIRLDEQKNAMRVLTDQTNLRQEQESVEFVNAGIGTAEPIAASYVPFSELVQTDGRWLEVNSGRVTHDYTDQRTSVEALLRSTDKAFALRGVAGAGKTTALREFHAGVVSTGKAHILLAPTTKAVEALKREIPGPQVTTVEAFLLSQKTGKTTAALTNAVITIDEWGLLSNRAGHALLRIAKERGALVRFVGDTRQHVAVEAGDFGRTLEQHSRLRSVSLAKINRQRDPEYRAAVMEMAASRVTQGLDRLEQKGWIHEERSGYLIAAAKRYLGLSEYGKTLVTERGEPHVLAVGPTHAEIRAFTAEVREAMREAGALTGPAMKRQALIPHDTTRAMRRDSNSYTPGVAVTLVSEKTKIKGLSAREVYQVKETPKRKGFVTLVDRAGKERTINVRANGDKLELGTVGEIDLAIGDRLWLRANSQGVANGTLATLAGQDEKGRLVTTDGFVVPEDYLRIAHGYATTSHTSQGLTANFAVVFGAAFDQKAIYVSHSRARDRVDTYVPSKKAFLARAERAQGERRGVLEAIADAKTKNGNSPANHGFGVGDKVNWPYEPRGGYGYTQSVASVVTKLGREKVQIRVAKREPHGWVTAERWVTAEKLSERTGRATPEEAAHVLEPEPEIQEKQVPEKEKTLVAREPSASIHAKATKEQTKHGGRLLEKAGRGRRMSEEQTLEEERQYLAVPYAEREAAKAAGAKWDWREKLWYIGSEGTRESLAKWLPENAAARQTIQVSPREEFAAVLRELGGDLSGDHPIMDGRPHRMATLDDDRGEKSIFYVAHVDGRPAGYAKNNRSGEENRWKSSGVSMTREQFAAVAPGKIAEREADRVATYERTAQRLTAQLETYPPLSRAHDYLQAKRISLQPGVFQTARGSLAIPVYDVDGKLWSAQYINSDRSKRFARESRKDGCFHVIGAEGSGTDVLRNAQAIVVAEGYATAASLKELYSQDNEKRPVAFIAAFDAGNVPAVARALRDRFPDVAMVIAADNDVAVAEEHGRNPGLNKGTEAAQATGAQLMIPHFSDEDIEAGLTDFNDLASQSPNEANAVREQLNRAITNAFSRAPVNQIEEWLHYNSRREAEEAADQERTDAPELAEKPLSDQNISSGVTTNQNSDQAREQAAWVLSSGELKKEEKPIPPLETDAQSPWDFRIGKDGAIEHFRTASDHTALRETADTIHILERHHEAMGFALERAMARFGNHLHFDGNQAGAHILVDLVVTYDLRITFTDERLNRQIELARVHSDLDKTAEAAEQRPLQQNGAGAADELTPETKIAGKAASQQENAASEVVVGLGHARYQFEKENEPSFFVRTMTEDGEQRLYWGKDLLRALEEAKVTVGDSITAARAARKPVTVKELQTGQDGVQREVQIDAVRDTWRVKNHGVKHEALLKAYDAVVKSPEDRKKLEINAPLLVAKRDQVVGELKRQKLASEFTNQHQQNAAISL
jgi:conjugative relaxase-like TrwC/TraI family protein